MKMMDTRAYVGMLKELVEQGREVRMVISGSSMAPFLIHGRDSIFFRAPARELRKGDIVFYERPGGQFVVHRICRVHADGYDIIGDAQTEIEHHVQRKQIFARVTKVERKGKILVPGTFWWEFFAQVWIRIIPLRPILMHGYARLFSVDKKKMMRAEKMKGKEDDYRNRNRIPCGDSCVFDRRKASPAEIQGLTENNGIICLSSRHSIRCCQRSTMLWEKHRNLQSFRTSFADR